MPLENPFSQDWRDCLREHYQYVIRNNDEVTRPSLSQVMLMVGFGERELDELRLLAFARAEDLSEDQLEAVAHFAVNGVDLPVAAVSAVQAAEAPLAAISYAGDGDLAALGGITERSDDLLLAEPLSAELNVDDPTPPDPHALPPDLPQQLTLF